MKCWFQYIHERESYEVLLAILKKRKKVTFSGCSNNQPKRPRLHSPKLNEEAKCVTEEAPEVQKVPQAKEIWLNLSQKPTAVVTPNDTDTQPTDPPNSLPDIITEYGDVADFQDAGVEEEMPPLEDLDA